MFYTLTSETSKLLHALLPCKTLPLIQFSTFRVLRRGSVIAIFPKIFPLLSSWADGDQSLYSAAYVNELDCRGLK